MVVSERGHGMGKSPSVTGITAGDVSRKRQWRNLLCLDEKRIIIISMRRSVLLALLTAAILVAAPLQAQRGGGGVHGGGRGISGGNGPGVGARPGSPNGSFPRYGHYRRFRNYGWGYGAWGDPYWDQFWDDGGPFDLYPDQGTNVGSPPMAAPPVVIVQSHDDRSPAPAPEGPKLIEPSQTKGPATATKPEPPTLFVFASGERLEASRYMLTANSLQVEIGRQQRRVALSEIDIDATIAANRVRGIDLEFPTARNEIFLGF